MLTADLVRATKRSGTLTVKPLAGKTRARALELAAVYLELAKTHVGRTRDELRQALGAVPITTREKKLADGLVKLIDDACEFATESPIEPKDLRQQVFRRAAEARRGDGSFDRAAIVEAVAREQGLDREGLERALYADLKGEHVLARVAPMRPEALVERYDEAQVQAVLLRAERVVADVVCSAPAAYRDLFRQLKFRRLLYRITPRETGYRLEIDGPYSLFDSVTKYGLNLALALPALLACDRVVLEARVRWGKARQPLTFRLEAGARRGSDGEGRAGELPEEVRAVVEGFRRLGSVWRVSAASDLLDLPGVGLCVPDLLFEHGETGERVYFEVLGFWSRDAVWKRVELVQGGLPETILFAVSSRLRVSERVLDREDHAALYVYKGAMSPRAIERKLEVLAGRG